jgi:hypothetical protein
MPATTVFFSWQSDTSTSEGRNFIEKALEIAVRRISNELQVDEAPRDVLKVDKDTKDVPGSPPIFETIRRKIDAAAVFIPDLTFVAERPNGDPCPNPNVLFEYGYALKSLTYHRIFGVMNAAFGKPSRESLPFDLASYRFPITYNLPGGASQDERTAAREKLVDEFERALKGVLASDEYKQNLPQPPPVSYRNPLDGRARFREKGEPIGFDNNPVRRMTGKPDIPVRLMDGSALWLRVMPQQSITKLRVTDLQQPVGHLASMPLYGHPYVFSIRGPDGAGIYPLESDETPTVAFMFTDGEIWLIDTSPFLFDQTHIPLDEAAFAKSLEYAARFLLERFGIGGPFRWVAGMQGVGGRMLPIPNDSFGRTYGPCALDIIEREGTFSIGGNPSEALEPFFDAVFDLCGLRRSPMPVR